MYTCVCVCTSSNDLIDSVIAENVEDNLLLADVLSVLKQLVVYGYYDDGEDVNAILEPLTEVLSGFSDKPFNKITGNHSQGNRDNHVFIL